MLKPTNILPEIFFDKILFQDDKGRGVNFQVTIFAEFSGKHFSLVISRNSPDFFTRLPD